MSCHWYDENGQYHRCTGCDKPEDALREEQAQVEAERAEQWQGGPMPDDNYFDWEAGDY
jgi:hypothetical protein